MATPFSRTLRSLREDGHGRAAAALGVAGVLLAGWCAWFALSEVAVYEVSAEARLVVDRAVYPVQAAVGGLALGLGLVHRIDDDADEKIQHDHRAQHDERDKISRP